MYNVLKEIQIQKNEGVKVQVTCFKSVFRKIQQIKVKIVEKKTKPLYMGVISDLFSFVPFSVRTIVLLLGEK